MNHRSRTPLNGSAAILVIAFVAAGCGGNANPMAPAMPTLSGGATFGTSAISGQLVDGGGSFGSAAIGSMPQPAATSGVQVSVAGAGKSTKTDAKGNFLLVGVPHGNVTLNIAGGGNNSSLMLSGVGDNQLVELTIQVQTGSATVLQESRNPLAQFSGFVVGVDPALLAFTLDDGTTILTDTNTWWDTGGDLHSFAELAMAYDDGHAVEVEGRLVTMPSSDPVASVVKAELEDLDVEDFELAFNRDRWSLGWVGNGSTGNGNSAVDALIDGGPFFEILGSSVEMQGPDGTVVPFATGIDGGHFEARFTKAQAISIATSVPAGNTVEIIVHGTLIDGTPWEVSARVTITDDDNDDDDDDDDGNGNLDPAVAAQAIADIQAVIDYIDGLVDVGTMSGNNAKPLITSLESAISSLEKLNGTPSINKLEAFLNKLGSSEKTGKISEPDADFIEAAIEHIIDLLEGA